MKNIFIILIMVLGFAACEKYEDCTLPIAGIYETHISGVSGPFDMIVSIDNGDNINIDAPWLNDTWFIVEADTDGCIDYSDYESDVLDIYIHDQKFDGDRRISGEGFYTDYSIQIDYTITDGNDKFHYTMVGSKK